MKILLLQLKRIGDLILTTPAIAALRAQFPEAEVTLVVSSECADLLPAIAGVDRILMARRNLRDLAAFLAVAGKRFDYCIDFTRNDRSAFLALLSGARKRIVSYRVRDQSKNRARVYTDFVDVRMRDCIRSITICLCLNHWASEMFPAASICNCPSLPKNKPMRFDVLGTSVNLTLFCIPGRRAGKSFGRQDDGGK